LLFGIINVMIFFSNYLMSPFLFTPYPWFIFPAGASVMICLLIHKKEDEKYTLLGLLTHEYCVLNFVLFFAWLMKRGFPWFLYPLLVLAMPIVWMYLKQVYNEKRMIIFWLLLSFDIGMICFMTWAFTSGAFPWFLIVWGVIGAIFFFLWRGKKDLFKDIQNRTEQIQEDVIVTEENRQDLEEGDNDSIKEDGNDKSSSDNDNLYPKI